MTGTPEHPQFNRPSGWDGLGSGEQPTPEPPQQPHTGQAPSGQPPTQRPQPTSQQPPAGRPPTQPTPQQPPTGQPPAPYPYPPTYGQYSGYSPPPYIQPRRRNPLRYVPAVISIGIISAILLGAYAIGRIAGEPRPVDPSPSASAVPSAWPTESESQRTDLEHADIGDLVETKDVWVTLAGDLRPDEAEVEYETSYDGFMDSNVVIDGGDTWGVVTRPKGTADSRLHGIDPTTGEVRWEADLPGAYCAEDLLDGHFVCAEVLEADGDLGTRWRVSRIVPADGTVAHSAELDAWLAAILVADGRVVVVEQRMPAPHAVVTGLNADLEEVWQHDLRLEAAHELMFSENRLVVRDEEVPDPLALLRPRHRTVADGLTALWIGGATAFLDAANGELVAMPACSRLVDDGERIWCNDGDIAVAYDYAFNRLHETEPGVRLAFPTRDPRDGDVTPAVFLAEWGELMNIDPATGEDRGPVVGMEHGDAFGMEITPDVFHAGGFTVVSDKSSRLGFDPATGEVLWHWLGPVRGSEVLMIDGALAVNSTEIDAIDPATGHGAFHTNPETGFMLGAAGERIYTTGLAELALVQFGE